MAEKNTKTKICFEYDGQEITLEYTADALKKMENDGVEVVVQIVPSDKAISVSKLAK